MELHAPLSIGFDALLIQRGSIYRQDSKIGLLYINYSVLVGNFFKFEHLCKIIIKWRKNKIKWLHECFNYRIHNNFVSPLCTAITSTASNLWKHQTSSVQMFRGRHYWKTINKNWHRSNFKWYLCDYWHLNAN